MWREHKIHTMIDCDDFLFEVQEYRNDAEQQLLFLGLNVHNFTPSVYKELKRLFKLFDECVDTPLLAESYADDEKWQRFVEGFGFKLSRECRMPSGDIKKLYVYYNNKKKNNDLIKKFDAGEAVDGSVEGTAAPSAAGLRRSPGCLQSGTGSPSA